MTSPSDLARVTFAAAFAAVAAGLVAFLAGMSIGQRDAQIMAAQDRHTAAAQCSAGELAVLIMRDAARPERDLWTCSGGSLRRAGR